MGELKSKEYYDTIYANSPEYKKPYQKSLYYELWEKVMALIDKQPVLEAGCGPGQFAKMLEDNGIKNYTGFDFSEEAIKMAKQTSQQNFFVMDAIYGGWPLYHFDTILLLEILEHTDDLRILSRIPIDKEVILTVPDFDCESHIRHFNSSADVVLRYSKHIKISHTEKFKAWYILKGIKQ